MARNPERTPLFRVLYRLLSTPLYAAATFRFTGQENVPATGGFLVVANHFTNADPATVGMAMYRFGRPPHFLAKESLFKGPFGALLRGTKQIPVDRHGAVRGSGPISGAVDIAQTGGAIVIFPEGSLTRDPDLWPMRGKTGAARIALQTRVPVFPVAHWGDQAILPRNGGRPRLIPRPQVDVHFGEQLDLSEYYDRPITGSLLAEVTAVIMAAITREVEKLRGETAPEQRWNPAHHGQTETGRF